MIPKMGTKKTVQYVHREEKVLKAEQKIFYSKTKLTLGM
jgi:hypothetical protein